MTKLIKVIFLSVFLLSFASAKDFKNLDIQKIGSDVLSSYERVKVVMPIILSSAEGATKDTIFGGKLYWSRDWKPLSSQKLSEVKKTMSLMLQKQRKRDKALKRKGRKGVRHFSSAVGFLQINKKTLVSHMEKCGMSVNTVFTQEVQERLMMSIFMEIGLKKYILGKISRKSFILRLSRRWASLPNPRTGKSYHGQPTNISLKKLNLLFDIAKLP